MKAKITDSQALRKITTDLIEDYLGRKGWGWSVGEDLKCAYWWYASPSRPTLLLPFEGCSDYARRMAEILQELEEVEGRSQLDIYHDILGEPTYEELRRELDTLKLAQEEPQGEVLSEDA